VPSPHDILLQHLRRSANVRLIARLDDAALVGHADQSWLHVFVPDLHALSAAKRKRYQYGFDSSVQFSTMITALLDTWSALDAAGQHMTVTQLGDFFDLWRESAHAPEGVAAILESFPDIRDRFIRVADGSLGARLILGNHDLEARKSAAFARAKLAHHLPGSGGTLMATHGDSLDMFERRTPDWIAQIGLRVFGRGAQPSTYPMQELREFRDQTMPPDQSQKIQGDASLPALGDPDGALAAPSVNVFFAQAATREARKQAHRLMPNALEAIAPLRTPQGNAPADAPNLRVLVVGHTHDARIAVDRDARLVIMDCGAWIESYQAPGEEKRPNRQLGAACGSDLRIYQLD